MTDAVGGECEMCGKKARQFCASCKAVFYCSRECQKKAWKNHKPQCRPFTLQTHSIYGRYFVASRDIKAGEIILKEPPSILGPKQSTIPICLGCHRKVSGTTFCKRCNYPLCSPSCQNSKIHKDECPVLAKASFPITFPNFDSPHPAYECITALRCLLLQNTNPKMWEALLNLQSHEEEIKVTGLSNVMQRNVVDFIRSFLGWKMVESDVIFKICGILITNSFELIHNGQRIRGIFPLASILAHSCAPNTKHAFDSDNNIIFRATQNIPKGGPIYTTYAHTFWDTYSRRHGLKVCKFFCCSCERCADPTELESNFSTLLCNKCGGEVRSMDPLDFDAKWACFRCEHMLLGKQIKWGHEALNQELREMGRNDPASLESFLERYKKSLHKNHRFFIEAKYALLKLYGNVNNFLYKDLSQEQIENKVQWGRELLEITNIVDPGMSLLRGTILFELQAAIVAQAKHLLSNDVITKEKAGDYMTEAVGYLQEASEILRHEPEMANGGLDDKLKWLSEQLEI